MATTVKMVLLELFYQNAIATYSHGPLLPKNPFLADWLVKKALQNKYQQEINLTPLDDSLAVCRDVKQCCKDWAYRI